VAVVEGEGEGVELAGGVGVALGEGDGGARDPGLAEGGVGVAVEEGARGVGDGADAAEAVVGVVVRGRRAGEGEVLVEEGGDVDGLGDRAQEVGDDVVAVVEEGGGDARGGLGASVPGGAAVGEALLLGTAAGAADVAQTAVELVVPGLLGDGQDVVDACLDEGLIAVGGRGYGPRGGPAPGSRRQAVPTISWSRSRPG